MSRLHMRLAAAVAAGLVVCGLMCPGAAAASRVPTGFQPADFTATSALDWWLLGTVRCGRGRCLQILRTVDGGRSFETIRTPPSSTAQRTTVAQLRFANARDGYAFGPELWSTHDGGHSWREVQIGYTDELAAADGYVYALVSSGGADQLMRSPVGRDRWRLLRGALAPVSGLWVQGRTVIVESQMRALVSRDAGAHFRIGGRLPTGTSCSFDATAVTRVFWALCFRAAADPGGQLVRSGDAGRTWRRLAGRGITPGLITGLAAASANVAVVATDKGLYRTLDGGTTWSAVAGIPVGFSVFYLGFTDAAHGVALGALPRGPDRFRVYYTSDGGASYHLVRLRLAATAGAAGAGRVAAYSPCRQIPEVVVQHPDGRISGCFHLQGLSGGRYTVSLQATLLGKSFCGCTRATREPRVRLTLSPDSGPPGTTVTVRGRVARPISVAGRVSFAKGLGDFMWDGAPPQGLMLLGSQIEWTSADAFTARVVVPAAPWVEGGHRPQVLGMRSGSFPLSVHCITGTGGCAVARPEGSAEFRLVVRHPPAWCRSGRACAALSVSPHAAAPGAVVQLTGFAPLVEFDDGGGNFIGNVALTHAGARSEVELTRVGGGHTFARLGAARFSVLRSRDFSSLGGVRVLSEVADAVQPIAADPADQGIVAACGSDGITLSVRGVSTTVPITAAAAPLRSEGMYELAGTRLRCDDVLPLGGSRIVAAFPGETGRETGVFANYPAETKNGGRSWTPLPVPRGSSAALFGGFRVVGATVEAVYARKVRSRSGPMADASRPVVEATVDGGASWTPAQLACPRSGPCVTFGPFLPGNCAMGVSTQYVLRSSDGGVSWHDAKILDPAKLACGDGQLAAVGARSALLVDALSDYPIQRTIDGGASWQNVSLPTPKHRSGLGPLQDFGPGGITLLPGGGLLLTGGGAYSGGWQLLGPGARHWCEVAGVGAGLQRPGQASSLTVIGGDLWWLSYGTTPRHGPTPLHIHELPLSAVHCA